MRKVIRGEKGLSYEAEEMPVPISMHLEGKEKEEDKNRTQEGSMVT